MRSIVFVVLLTACPVLGQERDDITRQVAPSSNFILSNYIHVGILNNADDNIVFLNFARFREIGKSYTLGGGVGLTNYPKAIAFPFYAEIRRNFETQPLPMSAFVDLGYSFIKLSNDAGLNHGGLMLHAGLGTRVRLSPKCCLVFNWGYMIQKGERIEERLGFDENTHQYPYYYYVYKYNVTYDFITFSIGVNY